MDVGRSRSGLDFHVLSIVDGPVGNRLTPTHLFTTETSLLSRLPVHDLWSPKRPPRSRSPGVPVVGSPSGTLSKDRSGKSAKEVEGV